jgi:hypothetical protein
MAKDNSMNEVDIVRFFETGAIEKAEVVFNIVREKMRERIRDRGTIDGAQTAHTTRSRRTRHASSDGAEHATISGSSG